MKIQSPPGMRDFYPEDMRRQNWMFDLWRRVSRSFGFSEYEGPIFEFLDLYRLKSGDEIVEQLFTLTDRGGRDFAIRPEMTPTLARMVAARANALPRPIKWFSAPRMCRAEKPQRGRLREFFQWNVDILGVEDPLADAEIVAVAAAFFQEGGAGPSDVAIRINSRPLMSAALASQGVQAEKIGAALTLIDRQAKLPAEEFARQWNASFGDAVSAGEVESLLRNAELADFTQIAARAGESGAEAIRRFDEFWQALGHFGVADYCVFDPRIVRGLAYYTGVVFEAHPRSGGLRALLGGGRYDDLTGLLDGPRVPGVGFGLGDAPNLEFFADLKRIPDLSETLDAFVIDVDESAFPIALRLVNQLRRRGLMVDFSYKRAALGKQLKQASARGARYAILVGPTSEEVQLKNLATGEQSPRSLGALLENNAALLRN